MDINLSELAHHLKQEKIFVESERQQIESLNKKLLKCIEKVYQSAFVQGEHWRNYNSLVLRPGAAVPLCYQRVNLLTHLQFIEGYHILGSLDALYGEAVSQLRENPELIAHCLVAGDSTGPGTTHYMVSIIISSLYGVSILKKDENYVLSLLKHLMKLQLAQSDNPLKLLHSGSCAFSAVYKAYMDSLPQAKVFLTAALHRPILDVLKDEGLLQIASPLGRVSEESQQNRLTLNGTEEADAGVQTLKEESVNKLVKVVNGFIESILDAMHCFPPTLAWLVRTLHGSLSEANTLSKKEIDVLCVDLVFTFFISSSIVSPEPLGIVDAPVSSEARSNLIQLTNRTHGGYSAGNSEALTHMAKAAVAQVLQGVAMTSCDNPDPRIAHLYDQFQQKFNGLFEALLGVQPSDEPPGGISTTPLSGFSRSAIMIPETHLFALFRYLLEIESSIEGVPSAFKALSGILSPLRPHLAMFLLPYSSIAEIESSIEGVPSSFKALSGILSPLRPHLARLRQQTTRENKFNRSSTTPNSTTERNEAKTPSKSDQEDAKSKSSTDSGYQANSSPNTPKNILNRVRNNRKRQILSNGDVLHSSFDDSLSPSGSVANTSTNSQSGSSSGDKDDGGSYDSVLVLPLPSSSDARDCPGLMSEESVLGSLKVSKPDDPNCGVSEVDGARAHAPEVIVEKRTRFSLSQDEGSIGNTSDNLEAISEAASNHSVSSSMDDVEQVDPPDNLSDMVSANVSGRGTPNVSGRDTPSSQVTEEEENAREAPNRPANIQVSIPKSTSDDIEEKFGRFEIKPILGGDETVSLVSDTWSTDVLGSDTEMLDAAERENRSELLDRHLVELDQIHMQGRRRDFMGGAESQGVETFETASEAWSTDVLVSESDRLMEFDTDDAQSVARSDDAGRSEVEIELISVGSGHSLARRDSEPDELGGASAIEGNNGGSLPKESSRNFQPIEAHKSSKFKEVEASMQTLDLNSREPCVPVPEKLQSEFNQQKNGASRRTNHSISKSLSESAATNRDLLLKSNSDLERKSPPDDESFRLSNASLASSQSSGSDGIGLQVQSPAMLEIPDNTADGTVEPSEHIFSQSSTPSTSASLASTGAIPKSISFDKTADRGDKEVDVEGRNKKSFFKGFKLPAFKGRRKMGGSISGRPDDNHSHKANSPNKNSYPVGDLPLRRSFSEDSRRFEQSSDEILAKYRKKRDITDTEDRVTFTESTRYLSDCNKDEETKCASESGGGLESSYAFKNAKRKLRKALGSSSFMTYHSPDFCQQSQEEHEAVRWLRTELAECQSLRDWSIVAQLDETIRCLQGFDHQGVESLIQSLKSDFLSRSPYVAYLIRSRQGLLSNINYLEKVLIRLEVDARTATRAVVDVCVRAFLEDRETAVVEFSEQFGRITTPDEKVDWVESFLANQFVELERDPTWLSCTSDQLNLAQVSLERAVMSSIYDQAMHPNGEGDHSRDQVLHEHIKKLSAIVTPNHKDLRIPKQYQCECPWPSAQEELSRLPIYKTSQDKVSCVVSASKAIMSLLSMGQHESTPAADDFIPVLVYVLIKANPPSLLSTVQYVDLFYDRRLEGEERYWWTQFCSSVEFIKTMDYSS